jgi:hypothetical protein
MFREKIRNKLNDTFQTISQMQNSSNKANKNNRSGGETPNNFENDYSELNDNDDRNSQHNFEVSQRVEEVTDYNEMIGIKDIIQKKNTMKINDDSSPKS